MTNMYDLVVMGAGPAGSVCAMHAAKAGLKTVFVDKMSLPRFKSCGGALSKRTHENLGPRGRKGIDCTGDGVVAYSPSGRAADYTQPGLVDLVVRAHWDHQLVLDATDAGAELIEKTMIRHVETDKSTVTASLSNGQTLRSRYLVIADGVGLRSYKAALGFTQPPEYMARTVCAEVEVEDSIIDQLLGEHRKLHIFFGVVPRGYGWLFPKRGRLNIGIGFGNVARPDLTQFQVFDKFVADLKRRQMIPQDLDTGCRVAHPIPFRRPFTPIGVDNILLAGDAGGFVSPVSGEGLYYATTSGRFASQAIAEAVEGKLNTDLVTRYTELWMKDFGHDMIHAGLWVANLIYRSTSWMERLVSLMVADETVQKIAVEMIVGIIPYGDARRRLLQRLPVAGLKSLRHD